MGRFTKPRTKVCRRLGMNVFTNGNVEKAFLKRESIEFSRRKPTEYGIRLTEKQKIMFYYGMREKQMSIFYDRARRIAGDTGRNFLVLCEKRLDNAFFSAGFAMSRAGARQLISHGNVLLNGKRCDIPSAMVKTGDTITIREKAGIQKLVDGAVESRSGMNTPDWIAADGKTRSIRILREPLREDVMLPVNEQLVVEFYSR